MKITKKALILLCALTLPVSIMTGCGEADGSAETNSAPSKGASADRAPTAEMPTEDAAPSEEATPTPDAETAEDSAVDMDDTADTKMEEPTGSEGGSDSGSVGNAEALILTAGEWNDNENWGFFSNLVNNNQIEFPSYGLNPLGRIAVTLTMDGSPAQNQTVMLLGENGEELWRTISDRDGKAYLFFDPDAEIKTQYVQVEGNPETYELSIQKPVDDQSGSHYVSQEEIALAVNTPSTTFDQTEVMFILDTTGSMSDEIAYLQKDFAAIVADTAAPNVSYSINFYRDEGDDYVTKCNPFSTDYTEVQNLLNREYADGGGDTPEAVAQILEATLEQAQWSKNSNKIAFLIFDAPPHDNTNDMIVQSVKAAAAKGIHLVPVVASNAQRETELFGRALAILTNSNYVFLTDDSGVGNSHLEPIIGSYDVELLHDIIVRNIAEISGVSQ